MALYGGKKRSTVVIALLLIVHIACCTIAQVNLTPRLTNGTWTSRFENVAGATFQAPLKRGLRSLSGTQKMSTVIMKDVVAIDLGGGTLQLSTTVPQKSNFTKDTVKWSHGKSGTALRRLLQSCTQMLSSWLMFPKVIHPSTCPVCKLVSFALCAMAIWKSLSAWGLREHNECDSASRSSVVR